MIYRPIFCDKCGQKLTNNDASKLCPNCGSRYYLNPLPTVSMIITDGTKILLVKRGSDPKAGTWDLPGGFIEKETLERAAWREIKEELGVSINGIYYVGSYEETYEFNGKVLLLLNLVVSAETSIKSEVITPQDDIEDFGFFEPGDIPWKHIGFDSIKKALEDYIGGKNE